MLDIIKGFWNDSKGNPTAFRYELIGQPFLIAGSLFTGVNVMVNPTAMAAVGFICFTIGSICGLVSGYKRHSMGIMTTTFHTLLNIITLGVIGWGLL